MPPLLILVSLFGLAAVVGGNLLVQAAARRRPQAPLAFVDAPPVGVAPAGTTLPRFERIDARLPVPRRVQPRRPRPRLRRPGASFWLFLGSFALYLAVGALLHYGSIVGDAQSRVADGWYVFFSRDPHLAAIGFVWNPLPSVLVMPLFLFKGLWPALTERGFAGDIMSAVFMAGCVVQVRAILREFGVGRVVTWVLVVAFACNPMVVYYGANGMTEAPYIFFLLLGVRYLAIWLRTRRMAMLVASGSALGFGYLVRYEAAFAAAAGGFVVALVVFAETKGKWKARMQAAAVDMLIFAIPPAAAFIGWAIVSYVITGHLFEQFSSQYGISSQVKILGGAHLSMPLPIYEGIQLLAFAPLLPVALIAAAASAWWRRDARVLALIVLAGTVLFTFSYAIVGGSIPFLRYLFPSYPLFILCIGVAFVPSRSVVPALFRPRTFMFVSALVAAVLAIGSSVSIGFAMNDTEIGGVERQNLHWIFTGRPETSFERTLMVMVENEHKIADAIDALHLRPGSIVTDTFTPCVSTIVMMSSRPHQFVITSDRDFQRVLADPTTFKAHYLLVPPPGGYGDLDEVNRTYPSLYDAGRGAQLVKEFSRPGCPAFRLYRVKGSFREAQ